MRRGRLPAAWSSEEPSLCRTENAGENVRWIGIFCFGLGTELTRGRILPLRHLITVSHHFFLAWKCVAALAAIASCQRFKVWLKNFA